MATWLTSDIHFGHRNIIGYCKRPWSTIEEMEAGLIANWNATVQPDDDIFIVGDFSLHGKWQYIDRILWQLRGRKHLILGNHDSRKVIKKCKGFTSVHDILYTTIDGVKVCLFHFPCIDWPGPRLLLHGHLHSPAEHRISVQRRGISFDVGMDGNGYHPINMQYIQEVISATIKG